MAEHDEVYDDARACHGCGERIGRRKILRRGSWIFIGLAVTGFAIGRGIDLQQDRRNRVRNEFEAASRAQNVREFLKSWLAGEDVGAFSLMSTSSSACKDDMTARAIASAIKAVDRNLTFVVLANSKLLKAGEAAGLRLAHEVFADRAYEDDANLVSRRKPGAVLHDASEIAQRVVRMVQDRAVVSITGKVIKVQIDTVCIHGDTPGAVDIARAVRQALKDNGIEVKPFSER